MTKRPRPAGERSTGREQGFTFVAVLVYLLVGTLIITPLLVFLSTGLKVGPVFQRNADELYAADAGMGVAKSYIKDNGIPHGAYQHPLPSVNETAVQYSLPTVNGKTVDIDIYLQSGNVSKKTYKITSVAKTPGTGSNTTIEAWATTMPYFWTNAATTTGNITNPGGNADINGNVETGYPSDRWPFFPATALLTYYLEQVGPPSDAGHPNPPYPTVASPVWPSSNYTSNTYDVSVLNPLIGPLYSESGTMGASNKGIVNSSTTDVVATANGTIYVKGDLNIGLASPTKDFVLNLNNHTIFVDGNIYVREGVTFIGSGCIIATGLVDFRPGGDTSPSGFVFIMSLSNQVTFLPHGDFYGSVAGFSEIQLQPGNTFTLPAEPPGNLNFPMTDLTEVGVKIRTWNIK